ncbi:baseplate tail-tube junction protein [Vibrio lentus]|uniref:Uncharacterized protein n=1 Tax=Vibrio lentus TaxID=136468 RepID=A0A2N7IE82_9VIBR|nr:baseplate tail-tube junction protein [Vibrio lentus]PML55306.1 hypothetical protein BCT74_08230 [Vibrio lentus]
MATVKADTDTLTSESTPLELTITKGIQAYQYPLTVEGETDRHSSYLVFYAVEALGTSDLMTQSIDKRSVGALSGEFKENETTLAVIQMYVPNMNESISHSYETTGTGIVDDFMMNYSKNKQPGESLSIESALSAGMDTAMDRINVGFEKLTQEYNQKSSGRVLGSRSAQLYKTSQPRQQTFNFQLRPRNVSELKHVGNILRTFMVYSSASRTTRNTLIDSKNQSYSALETPPLWFIEERFNQRKGESVNAVNRYTPKFAMGPAAITNIRMNKTPDQLYETFDQTAGDPIAIDLEITLTELRPNYSDYYEKLAKGLGKPEHASHGGNAFFKSFRS